MPAGSEARLKLGVAYVRLKQYDQAVKHSAASWPTECRNQRKPRYGWPRCILRQSLGDKLISGTISSQGPLAGDQRAMVHLFAGVWLEDQGKFDEAIGMFRQVAKLGIQPANGLKGSGGPGGRNIGPPGIRMPRRPSVPSWSCTSMALKPQAMYWAARAEAWKNANVGDQYARVCQRHAFSYYCQLAARRTSIPANQPAVGSVERPAGKIERLPENRRPEIEKHAVYQRGIELKILGFAQDAARELGARPSSTVAIGMCCQPFNDAQ